MANADDERERGREQQLTVIGWEQIEVLRGWSTKEELAALQELARDKTVVEIGSFCGRSTVAMAQTARLVYSIDHHRGDGWTGDADTFAEFSYNLEWTRTKHKVVPIVCTSWTASGFMSGDIADLVFIDGCHAVDSVCFDTLFALNLLKKQGGVIALHDINYVTIQAAMRKLGFEKFHGIAGNLGWLQIKPKE